MDKFSGNPLEYQYFSTMFQEMLERKIRDPVGRLTCLIKFTDGEAKDMIKHCIHVTPDTGYDTAITLLNKRYCSFQSLLPSHRKEIKPQALVKPGDAMGFRKSRNFVLKCETFSNSTRWNSQETPETLRTLVLKLQGL